MTVNELIAKLQVLAKQGHGELGVMLTSDSDYIEPVNAVYFLELAGTILMTVTSKPLPQSFV